MTSTEAFLIVDVCKVIAVLFVGWRIVRHINHQNQILTDMLNVYWNRG